MASYFDPTDPADMVLIPDTFRGADGVADLAAVVEADVIRRYTKRAKSDVLPGLVDAVFKNLDLGLIIFLRGYKPDADDADTDPDLKEAMRLTVADVMVHRLRQLHRDPTVASEGADTGKSVVYNLADVRSPFPPNWSWRLTPFDAREPAWVI